MGKTVQVVFDCARPGPLAEFWAAALGYVVQPPPPGYASWEALLRELRVPETEWDARSAVVDPQGAGPRIFFQRVPEGKTVKNRVHLDVPSGGDPRELGHLEVVRAEVARLAGLGATELRTVDEPTGFAVVMCDPEGNEFCVT
jgi:Glyoxalase-like domain